VKYCEYQVVKDVAKEFGYVVSTNDKADYDIMWVDLICTGEFISRFKPWQRINHFPRMY